MQTRQPESVPANLREAEWEDIVPRLLLSACRFHQRYLKHLHNAPTPEDLVQDAVTDLLTGVRTMPDDISVFVVLYGIIRSHVSNFLAREFPFSAEGSSASRHTRLTTSASEKEDPSILADRSLFFDRIRNVLRDDDLLFRMVGLWFEDPALKPAEIAGMLDVQAADIYNAKKRLRRRLEALPA